MLKRPWQIWLLYAISLAIVLPAMGWLTLKALELDQARLESQRQTEAARRQAEHERVISSALWRMDSMLTPLIAQEAARPYFVYESFLTLPSAYGGKGAKIEQVPSPLLVEPTQYVRVHFQLTRDNVWTSPQTPSADIHPLAIENGISLDQIDASERSLDELRVLSFDQLAAQLSEETIPALAMNESIGLNTMPFDMNNRRVYVGNGVNEPNASSPPNRDLPQQRVGQPQQAAPYLSQSEPLPQSASYAQTPNQAANLEQQTNEFIRRNQVLQNFAESQVLQQRAANNTFPPVEASRLVREGVSRPFWLGDKLLLARRVSRNGDEMIQGCWFDWPRLRDALRDEIADLLPEVKLVPSDGSQPVETGRLLATIPVLVDAPLPAVIESIAATSIEPAWSPMRIALLAAWFCIVLTVAAAAVLLHGVIALSERRAAFVSAVTHELRTPLTTFRLYAEMLAEDMVPDEASRRTYLTTLQSEADRLSHLVENVLQFARLERGVRKRQNGTATVEDVNASCADRLAARAIQNNMQLEVRIADDARQASLAASPSAIEQILFNLVDNACKYASGSTDPRIHVEWSANRSHVAVRVSDHGPGISTGRARKLFRPFSRSADEAAGSAPGVGLGLALSHRLARELGGSLRHDATRFPGASFIFCLRRAPEKEKING